MEPTVLFALCSPSAGGAPAGADRLGARQADQQGTETADTDERAALWAARGGGGYPVIILKEGPSVAATQGAPRSAHKWLWQPRWQVTLPMFARSR